MTANALKLIALAAMTLDHVGLLLFPQYEWFRILGRIAFPIFAFMIAEGCRYTHSRIRYISKIALIGIGMQAVLFIAAGSLFQSVFISFTLSILLIYGIDRVQNEPAWENWIYAGLTTLAILFLCLGLPEILDHTDYGIDYSIFGVMTPVACYLAKGKKERIFALILCLIGLSVFYGGVQWFCLLDVPLIGMYNGKRGRLRLKNLFYIYYPAHLGVIYLIEKLVEGNYG